jgi:cytochrome P450
MAHDEEVYGPDHDSFRPERFLESDARDPAKFVFGFGRRYVRPAFVAIQKSDLFERSICPGRHFAENGLFIAFASILHTFWIGKALDANGKEIPFTPRWITAVQA